MEGEIDVDAPLDYAEFHILASQKRYEAWVCSGDKIDMLGSGPLEQLMMHLPQLKDLFSRGSDAPFKLTSPEDHDGSKWFTKLALSRFLHIIGSPDIIKTANGFENEINQLEDDRKFHLSLYSKDHLDHSGDRETDSCKLNGTERKVKDEVETVSSDASKNELLRAMDLRLAVLRGELATVLNRAAGATCSPKDIINIEKLSQHFGAADLRETLRKFIELNQLDQPVDLPSDEKLPLSSHSRTGGIYKTEENPQVSKPSQLDTPVKYGVSPAKVAQIERQGSTESEESSYSSEEDQPAAERSRSVIRSASPRRSASPMRRIQIGRTGPRRATALTIKSLNCIPARDRTIAYGDANANSSEEEGSEKPSRKLDNVQRMSVQDAIHLFESKQRDQNSDIQKKRSTLDASSTNKSVLRRWSAGTSENSTQGPTETVPGSSDPMTSDNLRVAGIPKTSAEARAESDFTSGYHNAVETAKLDANLDNDEQRMTYPIGSQAETLVTQGEENTEKLMTSDEWNRQKEAELNQMLMKMMESKTARHQNISAENNISRDVQREQRGGFYHQYKEKRDEKLRGETAGKRAERQAQFKAMRQILDVRKAEMASANVTDGSRKKILAKPQKSQKSSTQSANPKKESAQPAVAKKSLSKASPLPTVRKSWPSMPSPRASGTSPVKTPCGTSSAGTTPTRRKPQPAPSGHRSSPRVERPQQRPKNTKPSQSDTSKSMKAVTEKKQQQQQQQSLKRNEKTAKTKAQTATIGKDSSTVAAKPSLYSKVTKKSSVVPLESKPFLRKGSGIGPRVGPSVVKTKASSQPEETLKNSGNQIQPQENELVTDPCDPISQPQQGDLEALENCTDLESESQLITSQEGNVTDRSEQVTVICDDSFTKVAESALRTETEEESVISPTAWVEIEEHEDPPIPHDESPSEVTATSNVAPAAISSPRVRHSLSQMLMEESAESDIIEWGNAENPPALVYQKDAPKGLKRLLKFARKSSKADSNLSGWSSPSVFSEGEDDAEESKAASKKNADNLLRKAALHAKNYGQQKNSSGGGYEKNGTGPEIISATRSFFSLSAFRGSKPN